jgi:hypothetical protein
MTVKKSLVAAVALIAAIAMSAIGATALAAPTEASPFELTIEYGGEDPWWEFPSPQHEGTFAARAPFCRSGTVVELGTLDPWGVKYRFTCHDGSGSVVVSSADVLFPWLDPLWLEPWTTTWRIVEGTGRYVDLRGKGSLRSEILVADPDGRFTLRSTLQGIAAEDAVAPTIGFSSVEVTKLRRPGGAYSLKLEIALRDNLEGNPVSYTLRVTPATSARELASSFGTTQAGAVSVTMRTPRVYGLRAMLLRLTASDEVGNESSVSQVVKLSR